MIFLKRFKSIKISKPAEIDLKDIATYTLKQWGESQKKAYLGLFKQSFRALSTNKSDNKISPLTQNRDDIDSGLMSFWIKKHVVYYRETKQELLIIRILHSQMDPEKHLP